MTDRRSRWFPSGPKRWLQSDQTQLLYQDFSTRVVPYRQDPKAYVMQTEGISPYYVEQSLTLRENARRLDGLLRRVASKLLVDHEVWLEVSFGDRGQNCAPFAVSNVDGVRQVNGGSMIQVLPRLSDLPDWFQNRDGWGREVDLDSDRMIRIVLPDDYPSHLLTQVVHELADVPSMADLGKVLNPWSSQRPGGELFDSNVFIRTRDLAITQAALPIGWTAREILMQVRRQTNEYYYYWRELHFLHFLASIRARAEEALRQVLALAGKQCDFVASVTAHGIHTPQEVQDFIHQFEAGDLAFSDVNGIILENATAQHTKQRRVV